MSWLDQSAAAAAAAAMRPPLPVSSSDAPTTAAARLMQLQTAQRLAMQAHFMARDEVELSLQSPPKDHCLSALCSHLIE